MARAEKQCEKCRWFEWARDMNTTVPYCNLKHEYEPERCNQYGTLEDMEKRITQLEQVCHDLYRIAAHEGYIGNWLHNRLVELGFAEGEE